MRSIVVFLIFIFANQVAISQPTDDNKNASTTQQIHYGADKNPFPVKLIPTPETEAKAAKDDEQTQQKHTLDMWLIGATIVLALFTGALWVATLRLAREARRSGEAQVTKLTEAVTAMNGVATATTKNAALMEGMLQKQMRAYVSVETGIAGAQIGTIPFSASVNITNYGFTPARNVCYRVMAGILQNELPDNFVFPTPPIYRVTDFSLPHRRIYIFNGTLDRLVDASEIEGIKKGDKSRLYVWGSVTYDDVYDGKWVTNFCHNFIFFDGEDGLLKFNAFYHRTNNSAT